MKKFFVIDNRTAWRRQRYISFYKKGGEYTWSLPLAERFSKARIDAEWGSVTFYPDREIIVVPCDVAEALSFPWPVKGDITGDSGPVLLHHPAVFEQLRANAYAPEKPKEAEKGEVPLDESPPQA